MQFKRKHKDDFRTFEKESSVVIRKTVKKSIYINDGNGSFEEVKERGKVS